MAKVAVVAGHRAEEFHCIAVAPGGSRPAQALAEREIDGVIHERQAGIVTHQCLLRWGVKKRSKQGLGLG